MRKNEKSLLKTWYLGRLGIVRSVDAFSANVTAFTALKGKVGKQRPILPHINA